MERAFGVSHEIVSFVTELGAGCYSILFLRENDCDRYYKYNKGLLLDERQEAVLKQLDELEQSLERGFK